MTQRRTFAPSIVGEIVHDLRPWSFTASRARAFRDGVRKPLARLLPLSCDLAKYLRYRVFERKLCDEDGWMSLEDACSLPPRSALGRFASPCRSSVAVCSGVRPYHWVASARGPGQNRRTLASMPHATSPPRLPQPMVRFRAALLILQRRGHRVVSAPFLTCVSLLCVCVCDVWATLSVSVRRHEHAHVRAPAEYTHRSLV